MFYWKERQGKKIKLNSKRSKGKYLQNFTKLIHFESYRK